MSEALGPLVLLIAVILAVSSVAGRWGLLEPIALLMTGFALSWVPGIPAYTLEPQVALSFFLPPLLFAAALTTSVPAFRANARPIGMLAVGLVLFTLVVVGLTAYLVIPGLPLAAALTLGAIVAPPDAVSATAVARRTGMPRRVVAILEGESLLNDATALVSFRVATAVAVGGTFSLWRTGGLFLWASVAGVALGYALARLDGVLRRLVRPGAVLDNAVSLATPFLGYFLAERVAASGVLAVVTAGLYLGHRAPRDLSAATRLQTRAVWRMIEFFLQGAVFLLIGLQLRSVVEGLPDVEIGRLVLAVVVLVAAVILARPLWIFPVAFLTRLLPFGASQTSGWRSPAVVSWAGMRGVVSLAAALALPREFPQRELLIFITLIVIVVTLVLQGLSLPWLIRRLGVTGPDPTGDSLAEATARGAALRGALERLDELARAQPAPEQVVDRLRAGAQNRANASWERLGSAATRETPSAAYRRLRRAMLTAERDVIVSRRDAGLLPEDVMVDMVQELDLEEALLGPELALPSALTAAATQPDPGCSHTVGLSVQVDPTAGDGCPGCQAVGREDWVHLRMCLTCGQVGCCDSSPLAHAREHFRVSGHPVIRSHEPGESWRWCYLDETLV